MTDTNDHTVPILSLLAGAAVAIAILLLAMPAQAQGWAWFLKHIHPTGQCASGREIIGSIYWDGSHNADGTRFRPHGVSAAHRTLPFGTTVTIHNPKNGRSLSVPIKDRGPYIAGVHKEGAIDLSLGAARALGMTASQYVCASY
jgi:rare lipoprotein A